MVLKEIEIFWGGGGGVMLGRPNPFRQYFQTINGSVGKWDKVFRKSCDVIKIREMREEDF